MKNRFLGNILLTLVWVALTGDLSLGNFVFGFVLCFFILWIITRGRSGAKYFRVLPKVISFFFFFLYELVKANIQVAIEVITPRFQMVPGIVEYPLSAESDMEITLLANLISLTPGTLSLDVSTDKKSLFIHTMYVQDKEVFIADIKNGFEKRLLEILR
ncbi:MAG TPA: Na+/H+ antiporter subunit E [Salinimicrobium sp.]|nr:Na+/H+ antiporter subunit E [Salinimicrobium sp.]